MICLLLLVNYDLRSITPHSTIKKGTYIYNYSKLAALVKRNPKSSNRKFMTGALDLETERKRICNQDLPIPT